ncbi:putative RNA-directed DNA polymerase, eukaryota, reverse transcriptase zinc-binding domain protein [Tanacetum coccineum]
MIMIFNAHVSRGVSEGCARDAVAQGLYSKWNVENKKSDDCMQDETGHRALLHDKLKFIKCRLRKWNVENKKSDGIRKHEINSKLIDIELKMDSTVATEDEREERIQLLRELNLESLDLLQKSRLKLAVEGDENSRFFHGMLKQKRSRQSVQGIMLDGEWISNPVSVKNAFLQFYKEKFQSYVPQVNYTSHSSFTSLSIAESTGLESNVSSEEIKKAVWDCGSDKSSGPDGFSFRFMKRYWDLFKSDVELFVSDFFSSSKMPPGTNSAFITLIPKVCNPTSVKDYRPISLVVLQYKIIAKVIANRLAYVIGNIVINEQSAFISGQQILDGPLMLSETIDWFKYRKKKLMVFKVDFEKAYDSVNWNYLDYILQQCGFAQKWRGGLRQGEPLSPFLFILIMEGLHIAIKDVVHSDLISGVDVGNPSTRISHFFYADDVVLANLLSIGDRSTLVKAVLGSIGIYYMSIFKVPESILSDIEILRAKFFWGGDAESKRMSWIKWERVLASHAKGWFGYR